MNSNEITLRLYSIQIRDIEEFAALGGDYYSNAAEKGYPTLVQATSEHHAIQKYREEVGYEARPNNLIVEEVDWREEA